MTKESRMLQKISKMREYLDYLETHHKNVQKAWVMIKKQCSDMHIVTNPQIANTVELDVFNHDSSKLDGVEFEPYRMHFYPTDSELGDMKNISGYKTRWENHYDEAWRIHKRKNPHHWQTWTARMVDFPDDIDIYAHANCVHMVCDWVAMSMVKGGTAKEYYEANKEEIILPDWADELIMKIFGRIY